MRELEVLFALVCFVVTGLHIVDTYAIRFASTAAAVTAAGAAPLSVLLAVRSIRTAGDFAVLILFTPIVFPAAIALFTFFCVGGVASVAVATFSPTSLKRRLIVIPAGIVSCIAGGFAVWMLSSVLLTTVIPAKVKSPNQALQRTAPCVTAPASTAALPPTMQVPRRTPRSLSLESLGVR